ncbi:TonB-dependent receptor [Rudanella paleaurantiibacter]|uniref:TonB-dependent receptor n=1 Tax=Rudanella paleaurantiibacter TaxID=2614655 RepID=A0A7J5TYV6_9BACT|nr:outer membrane beta-barrel family protein [Rudanella paleaurantiibacter]KAB7730245.1 TonB-dependent receptor [Rudanella paleaurantiibacter]
MNRINLLLLGGVLLPIQIAFAQMPGGFGGFGGSGNGDRRNASNPTGMPAGAPEQPQPKGNGKIGGLLMDSTTNKPVEFATVALISQKTGKAIDGTTADDKGRFTLTKVAPGDYNLQATFLGFQEKLIRNIKVEKNADIQVGIIKLSPDVRTLSEVEVTGQRSIVEEKVDRLVYNAEKDVTSKGGDAADVMRRVPMLSVDLDGNVSLRGSSNVRVLINNKPSTIVAASVADALKQIPADMIKSVEVITSPSAKYDAEGSAGIINIITKKNTLQGATLNVDGGVGNRGTSLGLNGNYRTGKMGFSLSGHGRAMYNIKGQFTNEQMRGSLKTMQEADTRNSGLHGFYNLGWDYDINSKNVITAGVRYGTRNQLSTQDLFTRTSGGTLPADVTSFRHVDIKDLSGTVDVNVDYTRTLSKPQQELSVLTQFSRNNRTNNFISDLFNENRANVIGGTRNDNQSFNQESTVQVDYQSPIRKNQMLELGGKAIFRQVNSDFRYLTLQNGSYTELQPANALDYDQNVVGSYLSYTYQSKSKYTLKVGGRYEYTMIDARFQAEQSASPINIPNYGNFVPSINLSKNLAGGKTIKLAYNRRLQRPGIQFLNPNVNAANPQNITVGNPYLSPELSDNLEASLSAYIKSVYLNLTVFGRQTNNSIQSIRTADERGVITTTFDNIGTEKATGINLFGNATLFSKWQIGGGFDAFYVYLSNNNSGTIMDPTLRQSNSGVVFSGRMFTNLQIKNGWGIQGFGGMRGNQINLQGTTGSFYMYSLGVRKDFLNKKGSLGVAAENFLTNSMKVRTAVSTPTFSQNSLNQMFNRGVRMTFSYKIGKMSFEQQPRRKRKSVSNDDVKGDGGGGNDGGGQQAAPAAPAGGGNRPRQ